MSSQSREGVKGSLPVLVTVIFRTLLPVAERDEVLGDLEAEYRQRRAAEGRAAAAWWIWRQALGSLPALFRRSWWRGMTGFEPEANRMRPGGPMFESWIIDFRYAGRRLARRPAYALLAILTLALGAGGTAAVFSVVRTLLLDPLPVVRDEQVGVLWFNGSWNEREFLHLRPTFAGFQRMAAYRPNDLTLETPGSGMRFLPGTAVSAELFDVLGTPPALGRTFRAGEDAPGAELVVVLSDSLWRDLGADPAIVGKRLQLGGLPRTVIGVMPQGFWFPNPSTRLWTAAQMNPQNRSGQYTLVGRVAEGASIEHMEGPLRALADRLGAAFQYPYPQWDKRKSPAITPAREFFVGSVRPSLIATLAAMGVILLIACANVSALMLGQMDSRAVEMSVRAALGADRRRLVQQLVMESLLVWVLAGVAGAVVASVGFGVLVHALPLGPLAANARLDWTVLWASMAGALPAAMLIAIVPGIALWRGITLQSVMATSRTGGVSSRGDRLEGGLVIAQMALAVLLAAGAGLLIRSVANLRAVHPGLTTQGVVVIDAAMPLRLTPEARRRAIVDILPALQAIPGVKSAAAAQKLPLRGSGDNWSIRIQGRPNTEQATTAFRMVTHDYFTTLGIPIRRGRNFDSSDREGSERVVIINEALAAKFFPGEDPIGRVLLTFDDRGERIVGVAGNAAEANLTDAAVPARYVLYHQVPFMYPLVSFVLRTDAEDRVAPVIDAARSTIRRDGTQLAIQETTTLGSVLDLAVGPAGRVVTLVSLLAGLALVLGAVGVYGVISHYVTRRSRDYGIQIALGQRPSRVVRQVVGRGAALVGIGSAIGIAAALFLSKVLGGLLYGVEATDPVSLAAAVAVLLLVGMLAAFVPARRASLTDPALVLRE